MMIKVAIIMGSQSDLKIMQEAADALKMFDVSFEMTIVSAHRTPERMRTYAMVAKARGIKVIVAGAGGAAEPGFLRPEPHCAQRTDPADTGHAPTSRDDDGNRPTQSGRLRHRLEDERAARLGNRAAPQPESGAGSIWSGG